MSKKILPSSKSKSVQRSPRSRRTSPPLMGSPRNGTRSLKLKIRRPRGSDCNLSASFRNVESHSKNPAIWGTISENILSRSLSNVNSVGKHSHSLVILEGTWKMYTIYWTKMVMTLSSTSRPQKWLRRRIPTQALVVSKNNGSKMRSHLNENWCKRS